MPQFFETEFPRTISYQAVGGPSFSTTVNQGFSGFEQRNKNWSVSRGEWQVSLTTPPAFAATRQQFVDFLQAFFLNVGGMADGFRLFDHKDHTVTAGFIGTGDGVNRSFQLQKTYVVGARTYTRIISKPITAAVIDYKGVALANTVSVFVGGVLVNPANYSVDHATGIVLFNVGQAPANAAVVTATFEFDFPVRFDTDKLPIQVEDSDTKSGNPIITVASLTLKEVRIVAGQSQG